MALDEFLFFLFGALFGARQDCAGSLYSEAFLKTAVLLMEEILYSMDMIFSIPVTTSVVLVQNIQHLKPVLDIYI